MTVQKGDTITFEGIRQMARNPDRKWWQVWKPRMVPSELKVFRVVYTDTSTFVGDPFQARWDD